MCAFWTLGARRLWPQITRFLLKHFDTDACESGPALESFEHRLAIDNFLDGAERLECPCLQSSHIQVAADSQAPGENVCGLLSALVLGSLDVSIVSRTLAKNVLSRRRAEGEKRRCALLAEARHGQ
eukprot:3081017-Amphidinium_carterae.1